MQAANLYTICILGIGILLSGGNYLSALVSEEPEQLALIDYTNYRKVLQEYVTDQGMVYYKGLKKERTLLDEFNGQLAKVKRADYEKWPEKDKIAFWVNAYNSLTLQAIIDHYPIKGGFSFRFPQSSIRRISGVWDRKHHVVMGRRMSLEDIEHETLRAKFNEPRIHMALVCAAMGCPPLRNEPYEGKRLDAQLDGQTRLFLKHSAKFKIDRSKRVVYLSRIFDWFGKDFVMSYSPAQGYAGNKAEKASLHFISRYLKADNADYLRQGRYKVKYLGYDWALNETNKRPGDKKTSKE